MKRTGPSVILATLTLVSLGGVLPKSAAEEPQPPGLRYVDSGCSVSGTVSGNSGVALDCCGSCNGGNCESAIGGDCPPPSE